MIYDYPIEKYKADPNTVNGLYPAGQKFHQVWEPLLGYAHSGSSITVELEAVDAGHPCPSGSSDCIHQSISVTVVAGALENCPYTVASSQPVSREVGGAR